MANVEIKDIFEKERFPKSNWQYLSIWLYFPFGLVLSILRFFIGIHACIAALLSTSVPNITSPILRILYLVLGVNVEVENKQDRDRSAHILVANYVSHLDGVAVHLVTNCAIPTSKSGLVSKIVPGLTYFGEGSLGITNMRSFVEKVMNPTFLQPEDTISGTKYLLKFSTLAGQLSKKVQPCVIRLERPSWANTSPYVLGASLYSDLFWFLFTPYTTFRIKYLPTVNRDSDEADDDFCERIRQAIATELKFELTEFNAKDKAEYEKRYLDELDRDLSQPLLSPGIPPSPELVRMMLQVSDVLPHVPQEVILKDLGRTRSVDLTISNILEGQVSFVPVTPRPTTSSGGPSPSTSSRTSVPPVKTEPVFAKSSQDRMLSFAERKAQMIAEARQRYIDKHDLKLSDLSSPSLS